MHVRAHTYTYTYICIHIQTLLASNENAKRTYLQLTRLRFPYVYHRTTVVPNGQVAQCSLHHTEAASLIKKKM